MKPQTFTPTPGLPMAAQLGEVLAWVDRIHADRLRQVETHVMVATGDQFDPDVFDALIADVRAEYAAMRQQVATRLQQLR